MAIFGPKPWVNLWKNVSFSTFLTSCFYSLERFFFRSRISLTLFSWPIQPKKKKLEKWPFLDKNHGLTALEKCQFFDFLNFLFLQPRKTSFRSRIQLRIFSWPILLKKKLGKMAIFGPKPWVWKNVKFVNVKCQFFAFWNFFFLYPRKTFFPSRILLRIFSWPILPKKKLE